LRKRPVRIAPAQRVEDAERGTLIRCAISDRNHWPARLFIRRRFAMARPFPALRTRRSSKSGGGARATFKAYFCFAAIQGRNPISANLTKR
jgi:hypothetical protein